MDNDFATGYALGADNGGGNSGMWGGDGGWWAIILFAMIFGWGNGGWGGGFGGNAGVSGALTRADLCQDMNFQGLENGVRGIQQGLCDGFYAQNSALMNGFHGVDNAVCQLGYQTQSGINALSTQMASCCCETQRAIDSVNYNMATNTCALQTSMANNTRDIIDSQQAGTRAILDYLCQHEMADLRAENQSLKLAASQAAQNNYLISELRPTAQPAYLTCNPYTGQYGGYMYGQGCGCNTGCNTCC